MMPEEEKATTTPQIETPQYPSASTTDGDNQNKIVVKKSYFNNIQTSINSLNEFFASNYQTKNFPILDEYNKIDKTIYDILSSINNVDPTWITDTSKADTAIDRIVDIGKKLEGKGIAELENRQDTETITEIHSLIGFLLLQYIASHFEDFQKLVNGIFSMEVFTKTSQYMDQITLFSKPIDRDIEDGLSSLFPDVSFKIFTIDSYVHGLFDLTEQITFPEALTAEDSIKRMYDGQDLQGFDIVIDDTEPIQEAAEVNYFTNTKPEHLKYNQSSQKYCVSVQFKKLADDFADELKKCNTTKELKECFQNLDTKYPETMSSVVIPFILANTFNNEKKYDKDFNKSNFKKYIDSYKSINSHNHGADRYADCDIFSTFKADKNGTIKFITDFLKFNLVNDESCAIKNNTLLRLFNIYDSRIYLDIAYNMIPEKDRDLDEDTFVKHIRARINKNSKNTNVYSDQSEDPTEDEATPTTDQVQEYVYQIKKKFGNMEPTDMILCEQYHSILHDELNTIEDCMYRNGITVSEAESYIGESFQIFQELEMGAVPDYMKDRFGYDDFNPEKDLKLEPVKPIDTPPDNSFDDLATSIDNKLNTPGDLYDDLGSGYERNPNRGGNTVYNINYNYSNSFNKDSNNTDSHATQKHEVHNDLSSGKSTTVSNTNSHNHTKTNSDNDSSTNKDASKEKHVSHNKDEGITGAPKVSTPTVDSESLPFDDGEKIPHSMEEDTAPDDEGINNNNNSNGSLDTEDSSEYGDQNPDDNQALSNGKTLQEMFLFLESDEPPSSGSGAGSPPKADLLTTAIDNDRRLLAAQQTVKKGTQYAVNTGKAAFKPISRTKKWLSNMVNSLVKRDEDAVKQDIMENPSYRSALGKAAKLCLHLGLFTMFLTINGWLAAVYVAIAGAKLADKERIKRELQSELLNETKIIDHRIETLQHNDDHGSNQPEIERLMRTKHEMTRQMSMARRSTFRHPTTVA